MTESIQRDLGRHDADIAQIKNDISDISSSLKNIEKFISRSEGKEEEQKTAFAKSMTITAVVSGLLGTLGGFLPFFFKAKGIN